MISTSTRPFDREYAFKDNHHFKRIGNSDNKDIMLGVLDLTLH